MSVKLFDFGLAVMHEARDAHGRRRHPRHARVHLARASSRRAARPAADVWAVGVLLWEALAGRHPFWSGSLLDTARQIEEGAPSLAYCAPRPRQGDRRVRRPCARRRFRQATDSPCPRRAAAEGRTCAQALATSAAEAGGGTLPAVRRVVPAGAAVLFTAWSASALPFFPTGWPLALAAVAGVVALWKQRLALAFMPRGAGAAARELRPRAGLLYEPPRSSGSSCRGATRKPGSS